MGKLSDRFTAREVLSKVSKLGGIFCSQLKYDESVERCRQYIQDDLQLDKEQQEEIIRLFEGEARMPSYMNHVRVACGLPELPKHEPFPCAKLQLGLKLEDYEMDDYYDENDRPKKRIPFPR